MQSRHSHNLALPWQEVEILPDMEFKICKTVPYQLRCWDKNNKTKILPHWHLACILSRSPQAQRSPGGPTMYCHLHRGHWGFRLTNEQKSSFSHIIHHTGYSQKLVSNTWHYRSQMRYVLFKSIKLKLFYKQVYCVIEVYEGDTLCFAT